MKVKLIKSSVLANLSTEEQLFDLSIMESVYCIRKLRALVESMSVGYIEVELPAADNIVSRIVDQVYSSKYNIWFVSQEYKKV